MTASRMQMVLRKGLSRWLYSVAENYLYQEKSITQSTVVMAFHKALDMDGKVKEPKKLGTFGASYLYPLFIKLGVIQREQV